MFPTDPGSPGVDSQVASRDLLVTKELLWEKPPHVDDEPLPSLCPSPLSEPKATRSRGRQGEKWCKSAVSEHYH